MIGITQGELIEQLSALKTADDSEFDKVLKLVENTNKLSIYWVLCNGVRFALDLDHIIARNFEPDSSFFKMLKKANVEDFVFDFMGSDVREQCRLQKQHDLVLLNGKFYTNWVFSYSRLSDNNDCGTFEICIVPEFFPKVYAIGDSKSCLCSMCKICNRVKNTCFKHFDSSTDNTLALYRMSRSVQHTLESNCEYNKVTDSYGPFLKHNIRDYLNACLYAVDCYLNRKKIVKKKEESPSTSAVKVGVPNKVVDPKTTTSAMTSSEVIFVTLKDRVLYEKRVGTKHLHHSSPREHIRRESLRHLKDGRVITVRSCVINKGKGDVNKQTVYTVD